MIEFMLDLVGIMLAVSVMAFIYTIWRADT